MDPWREQFELNGIGVMEDYGAFPHCDVKVRVSPSELIEHLGLDTFKNCPLHVGVKAYIFALYKKDEMLVGQKGMLEVGDVNYNKDVVVV